MVFTYLSWIFLRVNAAWSSSPCSHNITPVGRMLACWRCTQVTLSIKPTSHKNCIYLVWASIFCCRRYNIIIDFCPGPSLKSGSTEGGGSFRMRWLSTTVAKSPGVSTPPKKDDIGKCLSHRDAAPAYRTWYSYLTLTCILITHNVTFQVQRERIL